MFISKHKRPFDQNLVIALGSFSWPLANKDGIKVFIRGNARSESGTEHIAGKLHKLKVRDMEIIPSVLKQPLKIEYDNRKGKLYFGRRKGVNKYPYLKIVVRKRNDGNEEIITICASKKIREIYLLYAQERL